MIMYLYERTLFCFERHITFITLEYEDTGNNLSQVNYG